MSDLKITDLHKHYGGFHAVKGVSLDVPEGEFTVLVGPSGCGKSTLLRCIAGLEETSAGKIEIGGNDVTYARPRDRDIAMVFQNYALYPYLSVKDNNCLWLAGAEVCRSRCRKACEACIGDARHRASAGAVSTGVVGWAAPAGGDRAGHCTGCAAVSV